MDSNLTIRDIEMTIIHKSPNLATSKYFTDKALVNCLKLKFQ